MVKGNMILISADVAKTIEKILPQDQLLIPVSFKRKMSYDGYYIEEIIDKRKVLIIFEWLRKNNPLFYDIVLKDEVIDEFCESARRDADRFEFKCQANVSEPKDEFEKESCEEIPVFKQYPTVLVNKYEENIYQNHPLSY